MAKLLVLAALLAIGALVDVESAGTFRMNDPSDVSGLGINDAVSAGKLTHHFAELNKALEEKLPGNADPEANINAAKEIQAGTSGLALNSHKKKAYKLFVSLGKTLGGKCDLDSYKTLATIYESIHSSDESTSFSRISDVLSHYKQAHADECGPKYREEYNKWVERDPDTRDDLDDLFKDVKLVDHKSSKVRFTDRLTLDKAREVASNIGQKAINLANEESEDHVTSSYGLLQIVLWKSCKKFWKEMNGVLTPARFDALTDSKFLGDDKEFSKAIGYMRMCGGFLDDQEKYRKLMIHTWNEYHPNMRIPYIPSLKSALTFGLA